MAIVGGGELILILLMLMVMLAVITAVVVMIVVFWRRRSPTHTPPPVIPDRTKRICPQCRTEMAPDAPQGLCPQCLARAAFETQAGGAPQQQWTSALPISQIAGFFPQLEIIELLGHGGMGVVYKARQPQLDRFVALKILAPELSRDPAFAERFTREARALARLNHPNIVAVYESGKAGDFYYLVMEFVDGLNLAQMQTAKKRLSPEEAFAIVPKICDALQYAHDEGVVHRDIKPANILVDKKRACENCRLWLSEDGGARSHRPGFNPESRDDGHAAIHGAGAVGEAARCGSSRGHLFARSCVLRDAHGRTSAGTFSCSLEEGAGGCTAR